MLADAGTGNDARVTRKEKAIPAASADWSTLGKRANWARLWRGMNVGMFANAIGKHQSDAGRLLSGGRGSRMATEMFTKIVTVLGVHGEFLGDGAEWPRDKSPWLPGREPPTDPPEIPDGREKPFRRAKGDWIAVTRAEALRRFPGMKADTRYVVEYAMAACAVVDRLDRRPSDAMRAVRIVDSFNEKALTLDERARSIFEAVVDADVIKSAAKRKGH